MSESVLIVGSGGREHAIASHLRNSDSLGDIYVAPGNAGTEILPDTFNMPIGANDIEGIVSIASELKESSSGLYVVVGPEAPLVAGLGDRLRSQNIAVFGPNSAAAELEGSKIFATKFMQAFGIPHPETDIATNHKSALRLINGRDPGSYVIKADGLAGGKGVVLPKTHEEAEQVLKDMMLNGGYEGAGEKGVLIQERLSGPELSVFVVCNGTDYSIVPVFSQDHKRLKDGDQGPNTGGMGAYTPLPKGVINADQLSKIEEMVQKTVGGMADIKKPYHGVLYFGLMLADQRGGDPVLIEYNGRLGDPETQVILPTMEDAGVDVNDLFREAANGNVTDLSRFNFMGKAALTVCMAAEGYPESPIKGKRIYGWDKEYEGVKVYHGGTKFDKDIRLVTNGGRVLYVTGRGTDIDEAAARAYAAIGQDGVHFDGEQHRTDIGWQARKS